MRASVRFSSGNLPPKSIVNYYSSGGTSSPLGAFVSLGIKSALNGAGTAGVLTTVLNITGSGVLEFLGAQSINSTARTIRLKLTIDGTVVFDATSNSIAAPSTGVMAAGIKLASFAQLAAYAFKYSMKVEVASSLTESGGINVGYQYYRT